jgi:hypothetical protein
MSTKVILHSLAVFLHSQLRVVLKLLDYRDNLPHIEKAQTHG